MSEGSGVTKKVAGSRLIVISEPAEIGEIEGMVEDIDLSTLRAIDYDEYVVVAVFQGEKPTTGYEAQVTRITLSGQEVIVEVDSKPPQPGTPAKEVVTFPYLLIRIRKGELEGVTTFTLGFQNQLETPSAPTPVAHPSLTRVALEYISTREGIPVDQLFVSDQRKLDFQFLDKSYWRVVMVYSQGPKDYEVLVDMQDGVTVQDRPGVEQADREVNRTKYGKLEPGLFELLQDMKSNETIQVVLWIAGEPKHSEQEWFTLLAEKYPQAAEALEKTGNPFSVDDFQLRREIKQEYLRMTAEKYRDLVQPFVDYLETQGYEATVLEGVPAVEMNLSKETILELTKRPEVGMIYRADVKLKKE